jgi:translation elongation factor EF-Tu-like GTPase
MPGDNVEMVCNLVHDVAAEVGSRYVQLFYRMWSVADI